MPRYLGLGRYAGYTQGSSEYSVKSLTEREVQGKAEQGPMRAPLYSPHSLNRGKGGSAGDGGGNSNPYSALPYATYRRPAPGAPTFPPPADFSNHFQTFGRHECYGQPCSMSRPDLLMSGSWEPSQVPTQLQAVPGNGLNLEISCISTQQQHGVPPLATRVSLSKEHLAETRFSLPANVFITGLEEGSRSSHSVDTSLLGSIVTAPMGQQPVKFATLGRPVKRPMVMVARGELP